MIVPSYNTISCVPNVMSLGECDVSLCEPVGEYQVDTSHFVPACEAGAISLKAGDLAAQGAYDFKDGRDTGVKVPRSRLHSYTGDLAEASENLRAARKEANDSLQKAHDVYESQQTISKLRAETNSNGETTE